MEFIDRLKLFIKSKGLGQTKFEERVGFSRGYISKVKTSIGADKLSNIVEAFPDLNLDWLITGKGEDDKHSGSASRCRTNNRHLGRKLRKI
nr:helix-turn-helix transcriptional regulator [Proteiniphilum sp. UBA4988]